MKITTTLKIVTGAALTSILIWILSKQANLFDVANLLKSLPISVVLAGFVLYVSGHLGRAVRFSRLLGWKGSLHELFCIVCVHNLFVNTLPARSGELSYLYMTKKRDIPLTKGGPTLILARIFDLISIALLLLVSVFFAGTSSPLLSKISVWVAVLLILCFVCLFALIRFSTAILGFFHKLFSKIGFGGKKPVKWLLEKGGEIADSFNVLNSIGKFLEQLGYSVFIWGVRFVFFFLITKGLGVNLGLWVGIIAISLPILSTFLPIQGIGSFGTLEGIWALSFMALGVSKEAAVLSGFGFHLVFLLFTVLTGLYGFIFLRVSKLAKKS
ncbi:MAG: lysylphosphatidylglycerol synthase transmembrane domain-containing protein [archaeon]